MIARSLLLGQLVNTPHYCRPDYAHHVLTVLSNRANLQIPELPEGIQVSTEPYVNRQVTKRVSYAFDSGSGGVVKADELSSDWKGSAVAIVPVFGSLAERGGYYNGGSTYMRGYNDIKNDVFAAMQNGEVGAVAMVHDSPGGAGPGNCETSRALREMSEQFEKPIYALAQSAAYSASMNLFAAANLRFMTPSAGVGSVGVVTMHTDLSKALEQDGVAVTFIYAGDKKVMGNSTEPLSDSDRSEIQARVDFAYDQFVETVAYHLDVSEDIVRGTEAGLLNHEQAKELKFVDDVVTEDEFYQLIFDDIQSSADGQAVILTDDHESSDSDGEGESEMKNKAAEGDEPKETKTAGIDPERFSAIMDHQNAAVDMEFTKELIADGSVSVQMATKMLDKLQPAKSEKNTELSEFEKTKQSLVEEFGADVLGMSDKQVTILSMVNKKFDDAKPDQHLVDVDDDDGFAGSAGKNKNESETDPELDFADNVVAIYNQAAGSAGGKLDDKTKDKFKEGRL